MELLIFDFDGVFVEWTEEYRRWYSGALEQVIKRERGRKGLKILDRCREKFNGKGELALFILDIPFKKFAQVLVKIPREFFSPQPDLVKRLRKVSAYKVIYTGSPSEMVKRILPWLGFSLRDFDLILGWKEPELFPVKWACSPLLFETILSKFSLLPQKALAIGDNWITDLQPARAIGIKTAGIGKCGGAPEIEFKNLEEFLKFIGGKKEWKGPLM